MTAPYNAQQLELVAHMIRASKDTITAQGTLTERFSELWAGGMAVIDPSVQTVPVKIFRGVQAREGDRVCLVKFGSDWVVVGSFGTSSFPVPVSKTIMSFTSGTLTTTSSSYVDFPGPMTVEVTKRYDWSVLDVDVRLTSYSTSGSTGLFMAVNVNGVDYDILRFHHNNAVHSHQSGRIQIEDVPAGTWAVTPRWRRSGGSGTLAVNQDDFAQFVVSEAAPFEG